MPQNSYAETAVTLFGLALLALGTFAMFVRFLLHRRTSLSNAGRQLVADVKKGEGFTFHRGLTGHGQEQLTERKDQQSISAMPPRILRLREWLNLVNHHPDQVPHLFIEGGSGTGKTTLATTILHDRSGPVAIVGVKPDDGWSANGEGYTYKSGERELALKQLLTEVRRRLDHNDKSGLTIVLDDFTRLASDHTVAVDLYKLIADVGRSLRIRLILIARGRQVKGIGASGESDLLDHFVFIHLERGHRAALEYDEETYPLDTERVLDFARPLSPIRFWKFEDAPQTTRESILLSKLLQGQAGSVVSVSETAVGQSQSQNEGTGMPADRGTSHPNVSTQDSNEEEDTQGIPAKLTPEAIQILYSAWGSKSKIAAMLSGKKQKRLAMIDAALEEATAETTR